jgi:hypothetical protein
VNHKNDIVLKKYPGNYTCFKITTPSSITIISDPYQIDDNVHADIVTISHYHYDHSDIAHIINPSSILTVSGDFLRNGIYIQGIAGHHNANDKYISNIIYKYTITDVTIVQFSSQGEMPTDEMFDKIGKCDVLIMQIMGTKQKKLSPKDAYDIINKVNPKIIIPAHGVVSYTDDLAKLLEKPKIITYKKGILNINKKMLNRINTVEIAILDN